MGRLNLLVAQQEMVSTARRVADPDIGITSAAEAVRLSDAEKRPGQQSIRVRLMLSEPDQV